MASKTATRPSLDQVKKVKSSASTNSHQSLSKVTSNITKRGEFGYPNGHLGFLTEEQEAALVEFKEIITKEGLYTPATDDKPPSHNDALLLRFVRARRFVPKDALEQFKDTEQWRKVNKLDDLYMNIDVDDYDESRRHYPQWLGRGDKRGMPLYLYKIGGLDSKTMSAYTKNSAEIRMARPEGAAPEKKSKESNDKEKTPARLLRLFALYENLAGPMFKFCTALTDRPNPEVPITQSNNIVDISGVGLRQFWNLRGHMQDASVLATAHYPETLDRIFIVGAPSFFPTVWGWIKRWFDPITVSKIFILSEAQAFPVLSQFVALENIPKQYGGKLEFTFGDLATVDPDYADRITWKDDGASGVKTAKGELRRWPRGPVQWVDREDGNWDLLAVGSTNGKQRREVVATMKFGDEVGGWADHSMPHSAKHTHATSNGASSNGVTKGAVANPASSTARPEPTRFVTALSSQPEPSTSNTASTAVADTSAPASTPAPAPTKSSAENGTLVPIAVPGTATNTTSQPSTTEPAAKNPSEQLPPEPAIDSTAPVPLAAVAQPLPTEGSKKD